MKAIDLRRSDNGPLMHFFLVDVDTEGVIADSVLDRRNADARVLLDGAKREWVVANVALELHDERTAVRCWWRGLRLVFGNQLPEDPPESLVTIGGVR